MGDNSVTKCRKTNLGGDRDLFSELFLLSAISNFFDLCISARFTAWRKRLALSNFSRASAGLSAQARPTTMFNLWVLERLGTGITVQSQCQHGSVSKLQLRADSLTNARVSLDGTERIASRQPTVAHSSFFWRWPRDGWIIPDIEEATRPVPGCCCPAARPVLRVPRPTGTGSRAR